MQARQQTLHVSSRTAHAAVGTSSCRPRADERPGGSAVRTVTQGFGYSVRAVGPGVARLHSRISSAPGQPACRKHATEANIPKQLRWAPKEAQNFHRMQSIWHPASQMSGLAEGNPKQLMYLNPILSTVKWRNGRKKDQNKIYRDRRHKAQNKKRHGSPLWKVRY